MGSAIPQAVLQAYDESGAAYRSLDGGLINQSFALLSDEGEPKLTLQKLHPVFAPTLHFDIEAVTQHLASKGAVTPRLVRTSAGELWTEHEGNVWRALSWVKGVSYSSLPSSKHALEGTKLVARFHRALSDLSHDFRFRRPFVHDTPRHFAALRAASADSGAEAEGQIEEASRLRDDILEAGQDCQTSFVGPTRICHGDLKISNLLFDAKDKGVCLIDLDTVAPMQMAHELGDLLRSWTNVSGEDAEEVTVDTAILKAVAQGYAGEAPGLLSATEVEEVIGGFETICVELAARFCTDVFDDSYFGWDSSKYPSRRAHNLFRARAQLRLAATVRANRGEYLAGFCEPFA